MSLIDMLTQQLGSGGLSQIGRSIGADEKKTGGAVAAALPILLSALGRNASKPEGAQALASALDKDHDGGILENLGGFLGNPEAGPGNGILKHVLGGRRPAVERSVGKATGLDAGSVGKLLITLAPVVMGMLGKMKRQDNMDANGLASFLGRERQTAERQAPIADGLFGQLLDSDGDGDVDLGDVMKKGGGLLGGLFGGR